MGLARVPGRLTAWVLRSTVRAPGGVVEDAATGAAAAAFGGYVREQGLVELPATVTIHQGHDMGRPSLLTVTIPAQRSSGIQVAGTAVRL